ncbi:MAG: hypothetical protein HW386_1849 [Gammaproteobacteria bacterium]|nr:hypothetical protein [Gammaproteobacteria bacterium]
MRNLFIILTVLSLLSACAANTPRLPRITASELDRVLNGISFVTEDRQNASLPEEDIFGLSEEMQQFVDMTVAGVTGEDEQIRVLLEAVVSTAQLGVQYEDGATFTAREAFQQRRVNCLSFTIMMVSMLRYLGMDVAYNQVDVPPIWDLQGDTLVLSQHVNALVKKSYAGRKVVDINMEEYELYYPQRDIDDRVVAAMFYNNRGMELMFAGEAMQSFRYLRKALELAPELPYIWTNLGTLYRDRGLLAEAEIAYRVALERDPANLVAISKAARNYADLGDVQRAENFTQRAASFRRENPYFLYSLARDEFLQGDYAGALENIRAAISHYDKEHRFFFLQGIIYSARAEREQASASFKKALDLTDSQKQKERYLSKLEKLI